MIDNSLNVEEEHLFPDNYQSLEKYLTAEQAGFSPLIQIS
jgi:hypothetical protein